MSSRPGETPLFFSLLAPLGAFCVALVACQSILRRTPGAVSVGVVLVAYLIIAMPFVALALTRRPNHPLLPLRIALNATIAFSVLIILSMPFPPRAETIGSLVVCWTAIVLSVAIQVLLRDRGRTAFAALVGLAGVGAYVGYGAATYAMAPDTAALVKESFGSVGFLAASCISSLWYGRSLRQEAFRSVTPAL